MSSKIHVNQDFRASDVASALQNYAWEQAVYY
jgi:hypothetical protein